MGCRGDTVEAKDILGGNGFVTNVHITDLLVEVRGACLESRGPGAGGQRVTATSSLPAHRLPCAAAVAGTRASA